VPVTGVDALPPEFSPELTAGLEPGPDLLVALDIDGTVLGHDGSLSREVWEAVRELVGTGTHVLLATGRSVSGLLPVLDALGLDRGWAVAANGAVSLRLDPALPAGYEIADLVTFDPEPALRLLRAQHPDGLFAVEKLGEGFWVNNPFPEGELLEPVRVVDFEELCAAPASRVTMRAPELAPDELHEIVLRSGLQDVTYAIGWSAWLDLTPPGVTKASALEVLRERLEVPGWSTVAVGDGGNDVEMLAWAAVGVAMGVADPRVLRVAQAWTADVSADGLVRVLRSLLRGPGGGSAGAAR
jgi:hydroxymethylpyrimidine pyrophosphatase-like HAD family hydrolase